MAQKVKKESGGRKKLSRVNRQVSKLTMKIKRWERYAQEIQDGSRKGQAKRWDTSGIKKHIEFLENSI